jgi:hypothetical protein
MLTVQDCNRYADELEKAAGRLHLRAHREAYLVVVDEWRRLAAALEGRPDPTAAAEHLARLHASTEKALDSPLRRAIVNVTGGWELLAQPVESGPTVQPHSHAN